MLVLTRRLQQKIRIGPDIVIHLVGLGTSSARIGIDAPKDVQIVRDDAHDQTPSDRPLSRAIDLKPVEIQTPQRPSMVAAASDPLRRFRAAAG